MFACLSCARISELLALSCDVDLNSLQVTIKHGIVSDDWTATKISHSGANQVQHTFASHLITTGINELWIAKQMDHT